METRTAINEMAGAVQVVDDFVSVDGVLDLKQCLRFVGLLVGQLILGQRVGWAHQNLIKC